LSFADLGELGEQRAQLDEGREERSHRALAVGVPGELPRLAQEVDSAAGRAQRIDRPRAERQRHPELQEEPGQRAGFAVLAPFQAARHELYQRFHYPHVGEHGEKAHHHKRKCEETELLGLEQPGHDYAEEEAYDRGSHVSDSEYYVALRKIQKNLKAENSNIKPWLEFFFNILLTQAKQAIELLSKENIEKLLSPKQLLVWQYLEKVSEATPGEISQKTKVARPTVSQALETLLRLKKIERIGQGRTTRYKKK